MIGPAPSRDCYKSKIEKKTASLDNFERSIILSAGAGLGFSPDAKTCQALRVKCEAGTSRQWTSYIRKYATD